MDASRGETLPPANHHVAMHLVRPYVHQSVLVYCQPMARKTRAHRAPSLVAPSPPAQTTDMDKPVDLPFEPRRRPRHPPFRIRLARPVPSGQGDRKATTRHASHLPSPESPSLPTGTIAMTLARRREDAQSDRSRFQVSECRRGNLVRLRETCVVEVSSNGDEA